MAPPRRGGRSKAGVSLKPRKVGTSRLGASFAILWRALPAGARHLGCGESVAHFPIPDIRPIACMFHKPGADRVQPDIIGFFHGTFQGAKPVVEKSVLPDNGMPGCEPSLPGRHGFFQEESLGKGHDSVKVVRHGNNQKPFPLATLFAELNGFQYGLPDLLSRKLVSAPDFAVQSDEKSFLSGIDPVWHLVRESGTNEAFHSSNNQVAPPRRGSRSKEGESLKPRKVGTSRLGASFVTLWRALPAGARHLGDSGGAASPRRQVKGGRKFEGKESRNVTLGRFFRDSLACAPGGRAPPGRKRWRRLAEAAGQRGEKV